MIGRPPLLGALVGDREAEALFTDEADLAAMLRVEAALAEAESAAGVIAPEAAARIVEVCGNFQPDWTALAHGLAQDGVAVPALVKQVRAAVGMPHRDAVHRGATSQDIIDTSLVLRLAQVVVLFDARLASLLEGLRALAERDGARTMMAHTRMQAALPFTVGHKIETWSAPLERVSARLEALKPRLLVVQFGGPVGTLADLGSCGKAVAAGLAARLGLGAAAPWHSQRDAIAEFGSWLSLVSGTLGKVGQDIALMAQTEVAAVKLATSGTSSAMAHKANPVGAEVLVALARYNAGLLGTLHNSLVHENERSGAAWTLEWLVLPPMVVTAAASLRITLSLLDGLRFNPGRDAP